MDDGQLQVRNLLMGPGTPYVVMQGTSVFSRTVRADQSGPRAWNHGMWSGAEFINEVVVPITLAVRGSGPADFLARRFELNAAFAAVGDSATDVELRFATGGQEFLMLGRPRMVEDQLMFLDGDAIVQCAFVALDPHIYAAEEQVHAFGLPDFEGGLTFPFVFPFTFDGVLVDGFADLVNEGTADTSLLLRIDGPVRRPRVSLLPAVGDTQTLRVLFDLQAGQWLTIDTGSRVVLLNDVANRRGQVTGEFPVLPAGTSRLRFFAAEHNDEAQLTVSFRSAWW